ncbi:MAG: ArsA family ATPase [Spirulina sp. SIO3F2]|nr:ArsA family ATPase [Spirulina sp. SIO3F2]
MAQILTFIGKGGVGRSTVAIAAAHQLAEGGQRVLLASQDPSPVFGQLLGQPLTTTPQAIVPNLWGVQFQAPELMATLWDEEVKEREARYLRFPILHTVYGQELGIFPGMDAALALYTIRGYNASDAYDVIVYDGLGDLTTLRTLSIPETGGWYLRRFRKLILESDLGRTIAPFIQPITAAVLNFNWSWENFAEQPSQEAAEMLEEGTIALADPKRVLAYLVTTTDASATAIAQYYWGSAQQAGISVGGVIWNQTSPTPEQQTAFAPLVQTELINHGGDWRSLVGKLPNFGAIDHIPQALTIDVPARQVRAFLPGFTKEQVKLTQYGPELTIEAGDQRRNILLPPPLKGQPVKSAKFQDHYLIISL